MLSTPSILSAHPHVFALDNRLRRRVSCLAFHNPGNALSRLDFILVKALRGASFVSAAPADGYSMDSVFPAHSLNRLQNVYI